MLRLARIPDGDRAEAAVRASDPLERSCTCGTVVIAGGGGDLAEPRLHRNGIFYFFFYLVIHVRPILSCSMCYNLGKS